MAYEGALNYEDLKRYPLREVEILTENMNEINQRKQRAVDSAMKKKGGGGPTFDMGGGDIGNF